jgi:hypothetical protein
MDTRTQTQTNPRDSVLARFMLGFEGQSLPSELAEYLSQGLAGVVIYHRNFASASHLLELTSAIRRAAGRPVLIGIDQEGGTRFALKEPFTLWPSAMELGQIGEAQLVEQVARGIALELPRIAASALTRTWSPGWASPLIGECAPAACCPAPNIFLAMVMRPSIRTTICRFLVNRWNVWNRQSLFPSPQPLWPACRC